MPLFKPEILFLIFLFLQFAVVMFVVIKYIIDKLVERKFEDLHKQAYPDAQIVSSGQKIPFFKVSELVFLIFGPSLLAVAMVYSVYTVVSPVPQDLLTKAAENELEAQKTVKVTDNFKVRPEIAAKWQKILDNVPLNPTQVLATASAQNNIKILTSGKEYSYPEITFTWSGDKTVEPGVKIIGYYVYFGPKNTEIPFPKPNWMNSVNPVSIGKFTPKNSYTFSDLIPGQTYYLYIQTKTDSKTPYYDIGMEQVGYLQTLPAKKLFTYIYK
ncbi:MAG: fibronectin type III domain-containing protein [Patescibacteria group bacterium]|nr:fibronectin type III domain-containing protein [Patescibacteria group bacterium]